MKLAIQAYTYPTTKTATNLYRSSRDNAWKNFDPTADWSKTNHAFKIDMGLA